MEIDLKDKTVLCFDYGGFVEVAIRLSKNFGRVLYYCPYESEFMKHQPYIIGEGIPGVERVTNIWDYYHEIDLFFFTDLHQGPFQCWLRDHGKLVFGAGRGEDMELYRDRMKVLQKEIGLPVNDHDVVVGLDNLKIFLEDKEDVWVKTNLFRGDGETWHWINKKLSEEKLIELQDSLGANRNNVVFVVEAALKDCVEAAYDGFAVDGMYPQIAPVGLEIKDEAYIMKLVEYDKMPKPLKEVTDKLSPIFKQYNYRGDYGNEVKITRQGVGYLIDQTNRCPSPPTSIKIEIIENYSQSVYLIAMGMVPEIKYKYKFGCQVNIKSDWAKAKPQPIYFPEKYKDFVKIKNLYIDEDGVYKYIPKKDLETDYASAEGIGAVVGLGNTLAEAIAMCKKIAKEVEGYGIYIDTHTLDSAQKELDKLTNFGIKLF
jgi:hypothetical protein